MRLGLSWSLGLNLKHLTTGVVPTARADMMLSLVLAALWAVHQRNCLELVVLAAKPLLRPRNSLFWKRSHGVVPLPSSLAVSWPIYY